MIMIKTMKFLFVLAAIGNLVSCNTSIGMWRDTKATYNWTKKKIEESNGGNVGEQEYEYGAPIY